MPQNTILVLDDARPLENIALDDGISSRVVEQEQFDLALLLPAFKTGHSGGVTGVEFSKGGDGGHVFASVSIVSKTCVINA